MITRMTLLPPHSRVVTHMAVVRESAFGTRTWTARGCGAVQYGAGHVEGGGHDGSHAGPAGTGNYGTYISLHGGVQIRYSMMVGLADGSGEGQPVGDTTYEQSTHHARL